MDNNIVNDTPELNKLSKLLPKLTERANFERSLKLCIENAFYVQEQVNTKTCQNTKTTAHCYFLKQNRKENSYIENLVKILVQNIVYYTIPRKEIESAEKSVNSVPEILRLQKKAKEKFVDYWKKKRQFTDEEKKDDGTYESGEAGETLLFLLTEQILKLPQAICKMNHKTSNDMHIHGADGIHIGLTEDSNKLALYYGESKIYKNKSNAVNDCLASMKNLILNKNDNEELSILNSYCDLGSKNEKLVEKLKDYFSTDNYKNNELVELRGICLVGFESTTLYKDKEKIAESISKQSESWLNSFGEKLITSNLHEIVLNVFFIPFPCVEEFRKAFAEELGA